MSLKDLGIEKEYLQLIYNMNESARITVQTPFGETSKFTSDPLLNKGQFLVQVFVAHLLVSIVESMLVCAWEIFSLLPCCMLMT